MDMEHALRERGHRPRVLGDGHPAQRQQARGAETPPSGRELLRFYVPKRVKVDMPLQAYFRINTENMGQFERTLIIAGQRRGTTSRLHSSCLLNPTRSTLRSSRSICKPGSNVRLHDGQNGDDVYNPRPRRAVAYDNARMSWG